MRDAILLFLIGFNAVYLIAYISNNWHRWVTHRFGWQKGQVTSWTRNDGVVMVAFRCNSCQQLSGIHPAGFNKEYRKP
jgi:hypothetical protein